MCPSVESTSYLGNYLRLIVMGKDDVGLGFTPKITSDMIRAYNGEGDLVAWLKKVRLVAKLAKVDALANFLPLYLEGDALAVYLEMSEVDQGKIELIEQKLKEAFTDSPFIAYAKLVNLKWGGEPVDVYATEVRRLVGLSGLVGNGAETVTRLAFINGFPESIRIDLQQVENITNIGLPDILTRARVLAGNKIESGIGALTTQSDRVQGQDRKSFKSKSLSDGNNAAGPSRTNSVFRGKCFKCEGPHMARYCPENKTIICFKCGKEGHMSFNCESEN